MAAAPSGGSGRDAGGRKRGLVQFAGTARRVLPQLDLSPFPIALPRSCPSPNAGDWPKRSNGFDIPVAGTMGFRKAEVTAGGVALDEVDSHTMQSRLIPGLYFAGELLDLDGPIGGYNFQAAFSTGWLAGEAMGE